MNTTARRIFLTFACVAAGSLAGVTAQQKKTTIFNDDLLKKYFFT